MMKDEDEFVVRAEREGTPVDVSELRENPFDRRARPRSMLRALSGSRGLGAAALAVAVLVLGWKLKPAAAPPATSPATATLAGTTSADGVVHLKAADPRSLRSQIVAELLSAGMQASGYEQLGVQGIDAELPRPVPEAVSKLLQQHGVPVPVNGSLRIQIAAE